MKVMGFVTALFVVGVLASAVPVWAQEKSEKPEKPGGTKTVTGCLQKGNGEANEYSITDSRGKRYGLRSSSVNLSEHVGHKVTVTGKMKAEEPGAQHQKKEVADLDVTTLKMVSESCQ